MLAMIPVSAPRDDTWLERGDGSFQRGLIRLGVDADRIESTVAQQRGDGRQIHRFNQAASSVMRNRCG